MSKEEVGSRAAMKKADLLLRISEGDSFVRSTYLRRIFPSLLRHEKPTYIRNGGKYIRNTSFDDNITSLRF